MRFYTVLFLAASLLVSSSYAAYFDRADAVVSETAKRLHVRLSPLLLPSGAKMAENIVQVSRVSGVGAPSVGGIFFIPHEHVFSSIEFVVNPLFTDSIASVLASHFFPTRNVHLLPNTVAVNDPLGKLNPVNQKGAPEKMEASRRLGAFARLIQDSFEAPLSVDQFNEKFLQAWGVGNPSQIKVFRETSVERFATCELMDAVLKGQALAKTLIEAYVGGEGEHDDPEDELDPLLIAFQAAMVDPQPATATARLSFSSLFEQGLLKEGELEAFAAEGGMPFSEKNLMMLRKRHVAFLMSRQIRQEQEEGGSAATSEALAQVMTFFWKTTAHHNMSSFYEGFFQQKGSVEEAGLKSVWNRHALSALLDQVKGNPAHFWSLPPASQAHLLNLDFSQRVFKLPTSGMAEPVPGRESYSDCVESTVRGGILHLLRNPITGEMEAPLLPEGPFKDYFLTLSEEEGRLSSEGRNKWAAETWKVQGATRVKAKFGFVPSLENVLLTLQTMMGDQEPVVQSIAPETTLEEISMRYRALLARASAWFSAHLKRPVELVLDEGGGLQLFREENRTVGLINLNAQKKEGAPLSEIGYMNIMGHHGDYHQVSNNFSEREDEAIGVSTQPKEDTRLLVERVSEVASHEDQVTQLVPWVTPALMDRLPTSVVEQKAAETLVSQVGTYFPRFDFVSSPTLYVSALKSAIAYGSPRDLTTVLRAGILMDLFDNKRQATLMIHRLMEDPLTASKVPSETLKEMVRRSPGLLEIQAPTDSEKNYQPTLSFLERFLERGEMDILREVGKKIHEISFDFLGNTMKERTDSFWENLATLPQMFPLLREIRFMNNLNIHQLWNEAEKAELKVRLEVFHRFPVTKIDFTTLTPDLLVLFLPVLSEHTKALEYWNSTQDWQASVEKKIEEDRALRAKFAELQQAGRIPPQITLKTTSELAALSRTK